MKVVFRGIVIILLFLSFKSSGQAAINSVATKSGSSNTSLNVDCEGSSMQLLLIVHYTGFNYVTATYNGQTSGNIGNISGGSDNITLFVFTPSSTGSQTVNLSVVGSSGTYYTELLALKNVSGNGLSITTTSTTGTSGSVSASAGTDDMLIGGVFGSLGTISGSSSATTIQKNLTSEFTSPYTGMDSYVTAASKLSWTFSNDANYMAWALTIKGNNPLPISLLNFTAEYLSEQCTVNINWSTATEVNNREFTIEKTADGVNYTTVATVAGAGNSDEVLNYSTTDETPWGGTTYYRLKQTDFDGNYTYSEVAIVNVPISYSVSIYPNPATDHTTIHYTANSPDPLQVKVYNIAGMLISSSYFENVQAGENSFTINTASLQQGMYIIELVSGTQVSKHKFIKK